MPAHDSHTKPATAALTDTKVHAPLVTPGRRSDRLKRACDLTIGAAMFAAALPVIALLWAVVRLTSAGPGFYSQVRVGLNGRHYRIFKLRTMTHNCELKSGAQWCTKRDSRVTPIGRILRKLHLDELPQLWNVLRGDMSLVGPRPERPEFVGPLSAEVPGYGARLLVRPGVTGLAQIQLPADTDVESVRTKLVLDRCYVETGGFWLDIRIMFGTAVYLAGFSYARVRRLLRLPNPLSDENGVPNRPLDTSPTPGSTSRPSPTSKKTNAPSRGPVASGKAR